MTGTMCGWLDDQVLANRLPNESSQCKEGNHSVALLLFGSHRGVPDDGNLDLLAGDF